MTISKRLVREFHHLEDLVFLHGSAGAREAIDHLLEITADSSTVTMKWDGSSTVYWGREYEGGPFIMASHNGWKTGCKATNKEELFQLATYLKGAIVVEEEIKVRRDYAKDFANSFSDFEEATPKDFVGFVYADLLFAKKPPLQKTRFFIQPDMKTHYTVPRKSKLGLKINKASAMLVGKGMFTKFGESFTEHIQKDDFSEFNSKKIIVLNPYQAKQPLRNMDEEIANLIEFVNEHAETLDGFLADRPGMMYFKVNIYKYMCRKDRQKRLHRLGDDFVEWFVESKITNAQLRILSDRMEQYPNGLEVMVRIIKYIIHLKNAIIDQLELKLDTGMRVFNSEGWLKYADKSKKFGNIKLVPRHKWSDRVTKHAG